jgi:hypothetical protein
MWIREAQKHMAPTDLDPDPRHCFEQFTFWSLWWTFSGLVPKFVFVLKSWLVTSINFKFSPLVN